MKYTKLLMPLAVATTAITPISLITSCGNTKDITIDQKTIKSGDSYTAYTFKLPTVPTDKKVSVEIANKTADQEQVILDPDEVLTNSSNYATELTVADDGTVVVPVCYAYAPTQSSTSTFDVTFKYNNDSVTQTVSDLTFDYAVDYDVDLKDGKWESKITPAEQSHWEGKTAEQIATQYMEDVKATPTIFQSDARYSTSINIAKAIEKDEIYSLNSFRAYFNNVYADDYGLNVQMNYEVKGKNDSKFSFDKLHDDGSITRYTFTNFDLSCNFMTANGYKFAWDDTETPKHFNLTDEHGDYDLIGRMNGTFEAQVQTKEAGSEIWKEELAKKTITYDGIIDPDGSNGSIYTDSFVSFMFAFGLIHLTYDFDWATPEPSLKIISSYASKA